jgi:hypothetical protein
MIISNNKKAEKNCCPTWALLANGKSHEAIVDKLVPGGSGRGVA